MHPRNWYGFSVLVFNLFYPSPYLSPRECQFGLWYAVIFMTSRSCRAGINESCRITLTLVVLRTRTRFLCITTRKRERTYLKLLFHLADAPSRLSANARQRFSRELIHRVSLFYCDAARGCATFVYSNSSQPCTNLFRCKKMLFIITRYPFFAISGYNCNQLYVITGYTWA